MGRSRSPSLQGAARRFDTWAQAALDRQQRSLAGSAVACRWRLARSAATAHQKARRPAAKSIVVFAATALGPGSDAGRQPGLQRPAFRISPARHAGRRGAGTGAMRNCPAPRLAAHGIRQRRGTAAAGAVGAGSVDIAGGGFARRGRRAPAAGATPTGGSNPRLRSCAGAVVPRPALPARRRHPRATAYASPHHFGWLVDPAVAPRARNSLRGIFRGPAFSVGGAADPVCRFCRVAVRLASGRGPGEATRLLEGTTEGGSSAAGVAERASPPRIAELPRRKRNGRVPAVAAQAPGGFEPRGGSEPVHDAAGRLPDVVVPLLGPGGHPGWLTNCGPQPAGSRGVDWLLCEHAGLAGRSVRQSEVPGAVGAG